MSEATQDDVATLFALGLGPWVFPLRGKIPAVDTWLDRPAVDEATVRGWLEIGFNLGLPCGKRSGVVVIDDDRVKHGLPQYDAPPTTLVVDTPTGGKHYYYAAPAECPGNSASKFAPHVDVRGEGGYVVVPPSIHPTARSGYRFHSADAPGQWTIKAQEKPAKRERSQTALERYYETALAREVHRVRTATEGTRNDSLNVAAFNLGQLVGGRALDANRVRDELIAAATLAGLPEKESAPTVASGMRAGALKPRTGPEPEYHTATATAPSTPPTEKPETLIPGSHVIEDGVYVEQGTHEFSAQVLSRIAADTLYRRANVLGEINDGSFAPIPVHRLRTVIDHSTRLTVKRVKPDTEPPEFESLFRTCSKDHASLVLEYGQVHGDVRVLRHIASHPVCIGKDFDLAVTGWNPAAGVFLTCASVPEPLPLDTARAVLDDLIADFPFQAAADRENFIGLMLTPILRPALDEPVPMHLICSPMERTGKTKLAEVVLGVSITGKRTPAMQLGEREEEREKRILSVLIRGQGLLHLDNLSEFVDSASLASLLTSSEYQGRTLGSSSAPTLPNGLTVVGTGNNVHATGEIAKRIVPVRLLPASDAPEDRTDFRHPDLFGYVTAERDRVLGALLGLIEHWRRTGRPLHHGGFGGFERWTAVTGGILQAAGMTAWLTNMRDWRGVVDDNGSENVEFITGWSRMFSQAWVSGSELYTLAVEKLGLFGWLDRTKSEHSKRTSFGRVLNKLQGRVVSVGTVQYRVEVDGVGSRRQGRLMIVER